MPVAPTAGPFTLDQLAAQIDGTVVGDGTVTVCQVNSLAAAGRGEISFLSHGRFRAQLKSTRASAVIVHRRDAADLSALGLPLLAVANPYLAYARVAAIFNPGVRAAIGVDASAVIGRDVTIAPTATIGPRAVIGDGAHVEDGARVGAGCVLGREVTVGAHSVLHANVTVYDACLLGERCVVHSGVVIGSDGFGMADDGGTWVKIPQIGRVVIGNDVEIGANTTIDRGALEDTVIEDGVKLDNQIQIGHNCRIGANTAIAGCVGIAGSARIGQRCRIGGAAMILGHLEIADDVTISAGTFIGKSVPKAGTYTSVFPFDEHAAWLRNAPRLRHLDVLHRRVRTLEKALLQGEQQAADPASDDA